MKVLVVSSQSILREALVKVLETLKSDTEVIMSDHDDALEQFLLREPQRVLICEYEEFGDGRDEFNRGFITYRDIKNSASEDVVIIRSGFSTYNYPDYIRAPFLLTELFKMLK